MGTPAIRNGAANRLPIEVGPARERNIRVGSVDHSVGPRTTGHADVVVAAVVDHEIARNKAVVLEGAAGEIHRILLAYSGDVDHNAATVDLQRGPPGEADAVDRVNRRVARRSTLQCHDRATLDV